MESLPSYFIFKFCYITLLTLKNFVFVALIVKVWKIKKKKNALKFRKRKKPSKIETLQRLYNGCYDVYNRPWSSNLCVADFEQISFLSIIVELILASPWPNLNLNKLLLSRCSVLPIIILYITLNKYDVKQLDVY